MYTALIPGHLTVSRHLICNQKLSHFLGRGFAGSRSGMRVYIQSGRWAGVAEYFLHGSNINAGSGHQRRAGVADGMEFDMGQVVFL